MRILADKNIAREVVQALRDGLHDVAWVAEDTPGASDEALLQRATEESRLVLTFDKDFGELAFSRMAASDGIILLRLPSASADAVARVVSQALASRDDWTGHFAVIEEERIRLTALPAAQD